MAKITLIGAGSVVFTRNLLGDILSFDELKEVEIALMDIDEARLHTAKRVAEKVAKAVGANPKITATTNRQEAIADTNYVINTIQVGGYKPATVTDFEIPSRYGLKQTIGDTLGIGGIMRALRTIPVMVDFCNEMKQLAPGSTLLNYTNPMAMNTWAAMKATGVKGVGLCHSVQGSAHGLAHLLGIPGDEVNYICAGINHMAFYLTFQHNGQDLYPALRKLYADGKVPDHDRVRFEMMMRLGYYVTESSEHHAEYTPYFIRRDCPELIERFNVPIDEYLRRCESQNAEWEKMRVEFESDDPITVHRSAEYGSLIIHSMETGIPRVIYGNVPNNGLITNLMPGCSVEVPVLVDKNGLQPTVIGDLPVQLASYISTNIAVQACTVEAALTGNRDLVYHAAMLDPHTKAELTMDEIWAMVDDLLAEHGDLIPLKPLI